MTSPFYSSPHALSRTKRRGSTWPSALLLIVFTLVCHGLMLFDDALFSDDWCMFLPDHDITGFHGTSDYIGQFSRPFASAFYAFTAWAGFSLPAFRLVALGCMLANTLMVFFLAKRTFPRQSAAPLVLALFFAAYPGSKVLHWVSTIVYTVSLTFFLAGACLLVASLERERHPLVWKAAGFACMFVSFDTRSLLVFYYFFIGLYALLQSREAPPGRPTPWRRVSYLGYLLFPVAFWIAMDIFFPKLEKYQGYNSPALSLHLVYGYAVFVYTILKQLSHAFLVWFRNDILALLVLGLLGLWAGLRNTRSPRADLPESFWLSVLAALVLLGLAVAPYAAVGKNPTMNDFDSRHLLLVNLPLAALFTLGLFGCFTDGHKRLTPAGMLVIAAFLASFACYGVANQVRNQANWVKNLGLAQAIRAKVDIDRWTYFHIDLRDDNPAYTLYPQRFYEFTGLFRLVWGQTGKAGSLDRNPPRDPDDESRVREHDALRDYLAGIQKGPRPRFFMLDGFDPEGPALYLTIRPARQPGDLELALRSWKASLFGPSSHQDWPASLWRVKVDSPPTGSPS